MKCPECRNSSRVIKTYSQNNHVRRVRKCLECKMIFTTIEKIGLFRVKVLKANGRSPERFSKAKLLESIRRVAKGCNLSEHDILDIGFGVQTRIFREERNVVHTSVIANFILEELKESDRLAWMRFSSNYRNESGELVFEDPRATFRRRRAQPDVDQHALFEDEKGD